MADSNTTRYGFVLPEVGASSDTWGTKVNNDFSDLDAICGAITTAGSSNAYTLTTGLSLAAYVAGQSFDIKASFSNSGAVTIAVDGLATKAITKNGTTALVTGDIVSGNIYRISYDGTQFQLIGTTGTGVYQPLDATLTVLAALSWSSGNPLVQFTAADTVSLTLTPSVTTLSVPDGSAAAPSLKIGDEQNGFYSPAANQVSLALGGTLYATFNTSNANLTSFGQLLCNAGSVGSPTLVIRGSDTNSGFYSIADDNWGLSLGGTKRIDFSTTLIDFSVPTRSKQAVSSETSGTLTTASANKQVLMSGDCTINDGVFAADDWIFLSNDAAATKQIIQDTGMTLRLHGTTTTGTRTIAVRGGAAVRFNSASDATVYGDVT